MILSNPIKKYKSIHVFNNCNEYNTRNNPKLVKPVQLYLFNPLNPCA